MKRNISFVSDYGDKEILNQKIAVIASSNRCNQGNQVNAANGIRTRDLRLLPRTKFEMVALTGFEPVISALRGRRPEPLDDSAKLVRGERGWRP